MTVRWAGSDPNNWWDPPTSDKRGGVTTVNSSPTITNSSFTNNIYGFVVRGNSAPILTGNTFATSQIVPVAMTINADPILTDNAFSSSDNQYDAIGLIAATVTGTSTLVKRNFLGIENVTYVMLGQILVDTGASLTIEPGIVIKNPSSALFRVKGTLTAVGTPAERIYFTSINDDNLGNPGDTNKNGNATVPAVGNWPGMVFEPGSDASILDYVEIRYASIFNTGYETISISQPAMISVIASNMTISNTRLSNGNNGIVLYRTSQTTITNNEFIALDRVPVMMSMSADPVFSGNTMVNVQRRSLGLLPETVNFSGVIRKRDFAGFDNITYSLDGLVTIASGTTVSVEPGVVIKLGSTAGSTWSTKIEVAGAFIVEGDDVDGPVIFTSLADDNVGNPLDTNGDGNATSPAPGNWGAIRYLNTADDAISKISKAEIRYGYHGVVQNNVSVPVSDVQISDVSFFGLAFEGNSASNVDNIFFLRTGLDPIAIATTADPVFTDITFNSTSFNSVGLLEGQQLSFFFSGPNLFNAFFTSTNTITADATIRQRDIAGINNIAYMVRNSFIVGSNVKLTVNPGVVIKFQSASINVEGALIADATLGEPVIFTSFRDDSAGGDSNADGNNTVPSDFDWSGIEFRTSSIASQNLLRHVRVLYTSNNNVRFLNSSGTLDNVNIEFGYNNGVEITGNSDPLIQNTTILNVKQSPISMSMFSNPTFSNNTFSNVGFASIAIQPETWSSNATVPIRDFGGIENITYMLIGDITISAGTKITIPEGVVFKSNQIGGWVYRFNVNGGLEINGTEGNPVVFTSIDDDDFGNPKDTQNNGQTTIFRTGNSWIEFSSGSEDSDNVIQGAIFRHREVAIRMTSAAPTISNSYFSNLDYGIRLLGVSDPVITNNTFHNLAFTPIHLSLVSYPSDDTGNVISGTTFSAIGVVGETLVQNATLLSREFAGKQNIPYYFRDLYTVGTNAVLTIKPGVILKFQESAGLDVQRGLIAEGTPDSVIVFTSISDDFYGGDTNKNGSQAPFNPSQPWLTPRWSGILFQGTSLPAFSKIDHAVINYTQDSASRGGVTAGNSSPSVTNSTFLFNGRGVLITGSVNPVLTGNTYQFNQPFAVENRDKTFTVDASNSWWGSNTGPTHAGNPGGIGGSVTDGLDYLPFVGDGNPQPILGDVSLNGTISSLDASLILRQVVGSVVFTTTQEAVADVSGNGTISAMDASYVLQYVIGKIATFPAEDRAKLMADMANKYKAKEVYLSVDIPREISENEIAISLTATQAGNLYAFDIQLGFESGSLEFIRAEKGELLGDVQLSFHSPETGRLNVSMASTESIEGDGVLVDLIFRRTDSTYKKLNILRFIANETDYTNLATSLDEEIVLPVTVSLYQNYPNPFNPSTLIRYDMPASGDVRLEVFDMLGRRVAIMVNGPISAGIHTVQFDGRDLASGTYIYRLQAGNEVMSKSLTLIK